MMMKEMVVCVELASWALDTSARQQTCTRELSKRNPATESVEDHQRAWRRSHCTYCGEAFGGHGPKVFVALVDNWCGVVSVLETVDGEAVVGKPDEQGVLSHDLNVVAATQEENSRGVDVVTLGFVRPFDINIIVMHIDLLVLRGSIGTAWRHG